MKKPSNIILYLILTSGLFLFARPSTKIIKSYSISQNFENDFQINKFIKGDRVFHVKFGMGNVINIDDDKLDIKFDNAGHKKIQSNFVKKQ